MSYVASWSSPIPHIDTGDTAFVLISSAFVAPLTPGIAFFYGGLVRRKNFLSIMMQSFISMGIMTVIWVGVGYSLVFSGDVWGLIGNLDWVGLRGVGLEPGPWAAHVPALAHFDFREMVAIFTPALITGAFADRVNFKSYLKSLVVWSLLVYISVAHWMRGGGFIAQWGGLDFAGGLVVHVSAGFAALASICVVGRQRFLPGERTLPHSVAFVALGTTLLWFGWFGFNGGSAMAADGSAALAFVSTDIAGSIAMLTWLSITWIRHGKPSRVGALTGAISGLVCITPAAGYVPAWSALFFGVFAGAACYYAVVLKQRLGWDDALDVWAVHGVGGILGTMLLGVFALRSVNPDGADGLLAGDGSLLGVQIAAAVIVTVDSFALTYVILKALDRIEPVRVAETVEKKGLDREMHGEQAYDLT